MTANPVIEVRDLHKTYGAPRGRTITALRGVSLRVESGTIFGLIGQNGAGKTTLIKILLGLSFPTTGSASLLGGSPSDAGRRRRVGYLPEQMRLPDYFKATAFLRYMGRLNGLDSSALNDRIPALLERVGLAGVGKQVKAYSKGMQQRLGLAQALLNNPDLLILDEPTDGLDPLGRKEVRDLLMELKAEGKAIFLNSHLLSEVEMVCDQIAILDHGRVARVAKPDDFARGTGEYVVRMAGAGDMARAAVEEVLRREASHGLDWQGTMFRFVPRDLAQLNAVVDQLRRVPVEIEAVEPVRLSLEDFFVQVVAGRES